MIPCLFQVDVLGLVGKELTERGRSLLRHRADLLVGLLNRLFVRVVRGWGFMLLLVAVLAMVPLIV